MKTKYRSVIVPHVPTSTNETEDEYREDLLDNPGASLTPVNSSIGESKSGNEKDISPFNNYIIAPWLHLETGMKYIDAFILLPSGINGNCMYSINVSESINQLVVGLTWSRITKFPKLFNQNCKNEQCSSNNHASYCWRNHGEF